MDKNTSKISENAIEGGVAGFGTMNYQTPLGNHASPDNSQDPGKFAQSHYNKAVNQKSNTAIDAPKPQTIEKGLGDVFAKRDAPTPDEVISGIQYELGKMSIKDKRRAKELVLQNLKKDPHFYGKLKQLAIDDKSMMDTMTENKQHPNDRPGTSKINVNLEETKKIFSEMAKASDQKYVVNSGISEVMKEMWEKKKQRSSWKTDK